MKAEREGGDLHLAGHEGAFDLSGLVLAHLWLPFLLGHEGAWEGAMRYVIVTLMNRVGVL